LKNGIQTVTKLIHGLMQGWQKEGVAVLVDQQLQLRGEKIKILVTRWNGAATEVIAEWGLYLKR